MDIYMYLYIFTIKDRYLHYKCFSFLCIDFLVSNVAVFGKIGVSCANVKRKLKLTRNGRNKYLYIQFVYGYILAPFSWEKCYFS